MWPLHWPRKCAEAARVMLQIKEVHQEKNKMIVALFNSTTQWPILFQLLQFICVWKSRRVPDTDTFIIIWRHMFGIANVTYRQTNTTNMFCVGLAGEWGPEEFPWIIYIDCVCARACKCHFYRVAWIVQISRIKEIKLNFYVEKCDLGLFKRCDQRTCAMN